MTERKRLGDFTKGERQEVTERFVAHAEQITVSLQDAQKQLRELAAGKSILVLDTALDIPIEGIKQSIALLHAEGWNQFAHVFVEKAFGGKIPQNSTEIFQSFFGRDISLQHHDIRTPVAKKNSFDALLISGSPASIQKALLDPNEKIPGTHNITHAALLKQATDFYQKAALYNIPIMGVCYGHQLISHEAGGSVERMSSSRKGSEMIEPTEYGAEFVSALMVDSKQQAMRSGTIPVNHGDKVSPNTYRSAMILRASAQEEGIIHGMVHIGADTDKMTHNPISDADMIRALAAQGDSISLSFQSHPEAGIYFPVKEFIQTRDPDSFSKHNSCVAADMLQLYTNFLELHKRFR